MSAAPEIITILRFHRLRSSPIVISDLTTRRGRGGAHSINFVKRKSRSSPPLLLLSHVLHRFPIIRSSPSLQKKILRISWIFPFQFKLESTTCVVSHRRKFISRSEAFIDGSRNMLFHLVWFLIDTIFVLVTSCTFESVFEEWRVVSSAVVPL